MPHLLHAGLPPLQGQGLPVTVLARLVGRIMAHYRAYRCPFCNLRRADPTDYCPRCRL